MGWNIYHLIRLFEKARNSLVEMGISQIKSIVNFTEMAVLPKKVLSVPVLELGRVRMIKFLLKLEVEKFTPQDVWKLHVLFGFDELPPSLLEWELSGGGAIKQFRQDLSEESKKKIIDQTIKKSEQVLEYPEEAYLTKLWESVLATFELSDFHTSSQISEDSQTSAPHWLVASADH